MMPHPSGEPVHPQSLLDREVDFLREPPVYPEAADTVQVIETHMAWVFLVGPSAYKLKKCIDRPGMDFTTPNARRHDAWAEVRLNRRLAPTVYRGVKTITRSADGTLSIDGPGEVVDWIVHMRRLPEEAAVPQRLEAGTLTVQDVRAIARRLARFYDAASPVGMRASRYVDRFRERFRHNEEVLRTPAFAVPEATISSAFDTLAAALASHHFPVRERAAAVVDGHGDLRPEHVYLAPYALVIDCIAFDRDLRLIDPVHELAFFTMECDRDGATWVHDELFDAYAAVSGSHPPASLIAFYQAAEASTRARLAIWHLDDGSAENAAYWREQTVAYLDTVAEKLSAIPVPRAESGRSTATGL
jgi:aminoglycoside phosphotransferase family enzyme